MDASSSDSSQAAEPDEEENDQEATRKLEEETWVEWVKRTTHIAETHLQRASIDDWVVAQRRKKWRLAGHTARRTDHRWSRTLLEWTPPNSNRGRGHPPKKWSTDLDAYFYNLDGIPRGLWISVAQDRNRWHSLEESFVQKSWFK